MNDLFTIKTLDFEEFEVCHQALSPLKVPLEQTPLWGDFDDSIANRSFLGSFRYDDAEGKMVAIASATLYQQKGRDWICIKHGPLFASVPNTEVIQKMCSTLRSQFKEVAGTKPLFIRLSMPQKVHPLLLPFEHTMYDETVVLDLSQTEDEILAGMSQSGRQGYRRALKAGVEIREITENTTQVFSSECYPILAETGKRGGFGIHPESLYTAMLEKLKDKVRLYCAYFDETIVAWAITTEYDGSALYYYGGSNDTARDTSAPYLLHVEIIKAMQARGNATYDFMGIAGKNYPSLANVTQFKLKFSKNIEKVPQAYDLPLQNIKYHAISLAIKTKRKIKL
jgi:lipid II:glycine glycyltransferase (peptidoglycan interpeptide bridge formation enzyme)